MDFVWNANKDSLNEIAISYFGTNISYKKLFRYIDNTAGAFVALGVKKEDVVTLMLPNIPENVYCIYALNKIGVIANFVDLRMKGSALAKHIKTATSRIIVIADLFLQNLLDIVDETDIQKIIVVSPGNSLPPFIKQYYILKNRIKDSDRRICSWRNFIKNRMSYRANSFVKNMGICILYTSGTTGTPKGVVLTNENLNAMVLQYEYSGMEFSYQDRFLSQAPAFLAYNVVMSMHLPLSLRMHIVMLPDYRPDRFVKNVQKYKPQHAIAGPADWSNFLECPVSGSLHFLRTAASGSDKMDIRKKGYIDKILGQKGYEGKIIEGYSMTEAGSAATTNLPKCNVEGSVGVPLPLMTIGIFDVETKKELSYAERGEICINGPTVMQGYWKNEIETEKVIKVHEDGRVWLHTGDLGHMDNSGILYVDGRIKRIIVCHNGLKISPREVVDAILKTMGIKECCVVGMLDKENGYGQVPVAFIVKEESVSEKEILERVKETCQNNLKDYQRPKRYICIEKIPMTAMGKEDYRKMEKMAEKLL